MTRRYDPVVNMRRDPAPSGDATDTGNAASTGEVGAMFDRIAHRYDRMNALISAFQEPRWRRRIVELARLQPGTAAVDVATGTGKVAEGLADRVGVFGRVVGVDVSTAMLELARRANIDRIELEFVVGDAMALPLDSEAFDAATIAFGMRNLPDYERGFAEMLRVLRPGGRVVCAETARPRSILGRLAWTWFERVVPLLGRLSGEPDAYRYLVASARAYPEPQRIAEMMARVGFEDVRWVGLTFGVVTIHTGRRPAEPAP
ncbi:MAG: ubiquinone/menaquinone biosynthesis methyltransferase [Chloroflexi bacterium]|nr:ubiquinone/menaquinone biosynthesis methyltransferase [Chloroflexota bacterium]